MSVIRMVVAVILLLLCVPAAAAAELYLLGAMTDSDWFKFGGRLHILLLHMPIGIISLAFFAACLRCCRLPVFDDRAQAVLLLLGSGSAMLAAACGLMLAQEASFNELLYWHMYTGIAVFALSLLSLGTYLWAVSANGPIPRLLYGLSLSACMGVMCWSAHLGGSITHGRHFITKYAPWNQSASPAEQQDAATEEADGGSQPDSKPGDEMKDTQTDSEADESDAMTDDVTALDQEEPASDSEQDTDGNMAAANDSAAATDNGATEQPAAQLSKAAQANATLFKENVEPVLAARCYECHGASKQKSDLRLDAPQHIRIGGNGGKVVIPGQPENSSLYTLVVLDEADPDIMPSKGAVLTHEETELIRQWILGGAYYGDEHKQQEQNKRPADTRVSTVESDSSGIGQPDAQAVQALRDAGANVNELSSNGALLELDLRYLEQPLSTLSKHIDTLKKHVYWIDAGRSDLDDKGLQMLSQCAGLRRLYVHQTSVTDAGMQHVGKLEHLEVLNLYQTAVGDAGLKYLQGLQSLQKIYLWQTNVSDSGVKTLQQALPDLDINRGG